MTIKGTLAFLLFLGTRSLLISIELSGIGPAFWWTSSRKLVIRIMKLDEHHNQEHDNGRNHATGQSTRRKFDGSGGMVATTLDKWKFFHFL